VQPGVSGAKATTARAVGTLSRRFGRGGGTSLPGKVLLRLQPDALARMSANLRDGSVVVSATNGKTTTATMLAAILSEAGTPVVHNSAGANMPGGVATAMLESDLPARQVSGVGLFEVDEAWLEQVVDAVRPSVLLLANLFRDQLDRYGELEKLADVWRRTIDGLAPQTRVVLNADDPLVAWLGQDRENVIYFGIEDPANAEAAMRHASDSKQCRRCGTLLEYEHVQLGHLGKWRCPGCGAQRPDLDVAATSVMLDGMSSTALSCRTPAGEIDLRLPLPGLYNSYNALAAISAALAIGVGAGPVVTGLESVRSAFGRVESIALDGIDVPLLLIKNPTGANEVLRTIADTTKPFDLWIALNDGIADGRDVSWIWDADFERIVERVRRVTCSGTRAEEMALRLAYAGVARGNIAVASGLYRSFKSAAEQARDDAVALRALPTYTALLELRTDLAEHGYAPEYWSGR
jgi:UDP-N-acetylmuramyl tripeptide synthase